MMVTVITIAYNHEPYIRECLEGIVSQRTTFPFELLIHDDASTDRTADIIREYEAKYPDIVKPIYQTENQYSRGVPIGHTFLYPRAQGKYIAECEGDDYWTDPLKLQKQVDFLESHPDYGMCYTRVERYAQAKKRMLGVWGGAAETVEQLLVRNTVPTLTVMCRRSLMLEYHEEIAPQTRKWLMGDYPAWLYMAMKSKIRFLAETTGVYRIIPESACHSKSITKIYRFRKSFYSIAEFFMKNYSLTLPKEVLDRIQETKYSEMLPVALLCKDMALVEEARSFFKSRRKPIRIRLLLDWAGWTTVGLRVKYALRGFRA